MTDVPQATLWVGSFLDKARAIARMMADASEAGLPAATRQRIRLVADELLMNALYHAPTDAAGQERYREQSPRELARCTGLEPVELHFVWAPDCFALAVRDHFGSLSETRLTYYLQRARDKAWVLESKRSGAGLGLAMVARSASRLIFKLDRGASTQAIAIFEPRADAGHGTVADTQIICSTADGKAIGAALPLPGQAGNATVAESRQAPCVARALALKKAVPSNAPQR
jgi:hypothetical protein